MTSTASPSVPAFEVTNARVFAIAAPAMLANLTTPMLGIVATAVIGRLGEAHLLGGVAMSALVFDCIFWLFGFLRMGTVALTAQALGAGDVPEQRAVLARALLIAILIGLALIVLQIPLGVAIFALMGGSDAVHEAALTYFVVRIWSAPCVLANYAVLGWLVGIARAGTALALQIVINIVNMAATAWLVLSLDFGIAGAAFGSVVAEDVGLAVGLAIIARLGGGWSGLSRAAVLQRDKLMRMLAVNRDIMIRTAALIAAFAFFTAQGARAGDVTLAANAVLHNFILVGSFFLDGMAAAAEQICGRTVGGHNRAGFARAVRLVIAWGFTFGVATSLVLLAGGPHFIALITTNEAVRTAAAAFMPFAVLAPTMGVAAYIFDGIYVGATWTRDMRNLMVAALIIYLAMWWALQSLGNTGLWLALLIFLAARGLLQAARFPALARATFQ